VRKEDEVRSASSAPGRGALAALLLLIGCLNPRPEELPSSADPSQPNLELGEPNPNLADPGGDDPADVNAAGAAPADEGDAVNRPAFAPPAPESPGAPPEPADAGADAAAEADPDAG
jgi:hypothetical protein